MEKLLREKDSINSDLTRHKNELAIYQSSMVEVSNNLSISVTDVEL